MHLNLANRSVEITEGVCQCGCGGRTKRATKTCSSRNVRKGEYSRFLPGHSARHAKPRYEIREDTGCWIWLRKCCPKWGYGHATIDGKTVLAHRAMYEELKGSIPDGMELDHLCTTPNCVNPDHLEAVTPAENTRRTGRVKLTIDQANEIRKRYNSGESQSTIARRFGVSQSLVSNIVTGKYWR